MKISNNFTQYDLNPYGHIIDDVKILAAPLGSFSFKHTPRQGNSIAHILARKAKILLM